MNLHPNTRYTLIRFLSVLPLCLTGFFYTIVNSAEPANPPAKVDRNVQETGFNTITLTPKAETRLQIKTVAVEKRNLPRLRTFGGEVIIPLENQGGQQSIFTVLPSMTPADRIQVAQAQVDADGAIKAARAVVEARNVEMERATRMLKERSGSRKAVDDARAQLQIAEADLEKAQARRELLGPPVLYNQTPDKVWIRVPVYAGDLSRIDRKGGVSVKSLSASPEEARLRATLVEGPPSANAAAASVDLFFACDNPNQTFQLGERVDVSLNLKATENPLVVSWSSIITDIYGGTWVYENTGDHQFVRKRVQVARVVDNLAVLSDGPPVGTPVVTDGAAELFGTEVGFSK